MVSWLLRAFILGFRISFIGLLCIEGRRLFGGGGIGQGRILLFILTSGSGLTWCSLTPFSQCDPLCTPGGSSVLADPARIVEEFRKAWLPCFCALGKERPALRNLLMRLRVGCFSSRRLLCRGLLRQCLLGLFIVRVLLLVVLMVGSGGS